MECEDLTADDNSWRVVESHLKKARVRAWKSANNGHRLKLRHLFTASGKLIPTWLDKSAQSKVEFTSLFLSNNNQSSSSSTMGESAGPIHSTPVRPTPPPFHRPPVQSLLPQPQVPPLLRRPPVPPPGVRHNIDDLDQWLRDQREAAQQVPTCPAEPAEELQQSRRTRKNRRFIARTKFRNKGRRFNRRKLLSLIHI